MRSLYSCYRKAFKESVEKVKFEKELKVVEYPYKSPDREKLSTEFVRISKPDTKKFLVLTSGVVGLDYFIGSLIQKNLLDQLTEFSMPSNTGLILVHGTNPWGAAWLRPTNINNTILNHNYFDPKDSLEDIEKEFKDLDKFRSHCKYISNFINPKNFENELKLSLKALWYTVKLGHQPFLKTLFTPQRHNLIGLNYGGLQIQREIQVLKETLNSLLPHDYEQVVYLDLQTLNLTGKTKVLVKTEDDLSFNWFSSNLKSEVINENSKMNYASVVTGFRESEDWTTAAVGIYAGSPYSRFRALRDENLFHNLNIWTENWSRGELDFWPIEGYIESKYKQKLLYNYFRQDPIWKNQAINSTLDIILNTIQGLSRS